MGTFFIAKKSKKLSRGNACLKLFVTNKGIACVALVKSKSEVMIALKKFTKEKWAPEDSTIDAAREDKSQEVKPFLNTLGATLRVLEEGTQWDNKAGLCIGILAEAVRTGMNEADSPLALWNYCVERRARVRNLTSKKLFQLHGSNYHVELAGEEGDMSSLF